MKIIPCNFSRSEDVIIRNKVCIKDHLNVLHLNHTLGSFTKNYFFENYIDNIDTKLKYFLKLMNLSVDKILFIYFSIKYKFELTKELSKVNLGSKLKLNVECNGLKIVSVKQNSIAEKYGLSVGDVLLRIDSKEINSIEKFNLLWNDRTISTKILSFLRKNETQDKRVEIISTN